MITSLRITIIGAGIGGLTAALALQRRGFRPRVYERAAIVREIGAGVVIWPNARRALRDLEIDVALAARSSQVHRAYLCDYATGKMVNIRWGEPLVEQHGMGNLQVHRADLHGLLLTAVLANDAEAVHPHHTFVRLDQDADGVTVAFANGARLRSDVVIGADGNASAVRSQVFPGEMPLFNGQVSFRALIPWPLLPPSIAERQYAMYPGPQRMLLHYPLRGGQLMNLIGTGRAAAWEEEGWTIPASNAEFVAAYADFAPELLTMIRAIPEGALFKWGLRDREPLATWTHGRVAMLGDAAHPMTPFLGQGACIAIEDGLVLGRAFAVAGSIEEALARYEAARKPRGTTVQRLSREQGRHLQASRAGQAAPDLGLLDYDPVTVPV
ncbi:MAG: monooxygenase [Candidatus Tectomicrobia bacterium]|uniref:Monooxygenase n=1 Tax=Tectimicrobiota bacterium TaxID=2528274 RepID=A0A938B340_UNCTE|nr:monooxygenase [Candidatus Tectomicrobia bacterium]